MTKFMHLLYISLTEPAVQHSNATSVKESALRTGLIYKIYVSQLNLKFPVCDYACGSVLPFNTPAARSARAARSDFSPFRIVRVVRIVRDPCSRLVVMCRDYGEKSRHASAVALTFALPLAHNSHGSSSDP